MEVKEQWQRLAIELGFELKNEIRPRVELPSLHKMAAKALKKGNLRQAEQILETPLFKEVFKKVFIGSATGFYRDYEFAVFRSTSDTDSSNPVYYVNMVLMFKQSLELGLDIRQAGSLSKIGKALFAGKFVKIPNNPELDALAAVQAKDKDRAGRLLSDSGLQEKLLALYRFSHRFMITDEAIRWDERGTIIQKDRALKIMDMMAETAQKFE